MTQHSDSGDEYVPSTEDDRIAERLAELTEEEAEARAEALLSLIHI